MRSDNVGRRGWSAADSRTWASHLAAWLMVTCATSWISLSARGAEVALTADRLFDPSHVLRVEIELPAEDWTKLRLQTRSFETVFAESAGNSPFTYFSGKLTIDGVPCGAVKLRKKGFLGSVDEERPSLKVQLVDADDGQPAPIELKRLTLNNNKQDMGLVSQYLTYELFRKAGLPAPRTSFARVSVNGEDLGIYTHVETIDEPFLRRSFGGDGEGPLYEGTLADFFPSHIEKLEAKSESAADKERLRELMEVLQPDRPLDMARLESLVDIDSFLTYWALESLINFWDGYCGNQNNFFVYGNPADHKYYFIPWGADMAFSRGGMGFMMGGGGAESIKANSLLANRLIQDPAIQQRYYDRLRKILEEVWNEEWLLSEMDRQVALVADQLHPAQGQYERGLESMREFITGRRELMEEELARWPVEFPSEPRKPMYMKQVGTASGSFEAQWSEEAPVERLDVGHAKVKLRLDEQDVEFERWGANAEPGQPGFGGPGRGPRGRRGGGRFGGPGGPGGPGGGRPPREGAGRWAFGPNQPEQPPASVVLVGEMADGELMTLTLTVPHDKFEPTGDEPLMVQGMLKPGSPDSFTGFEDMRTVGGKLQLQFAQRQPGADVIGQFDLKVSVMRGGPRGR
ncbi:MAG: CotH kinase family protein [Pirellulales bacterium]